MDFSSLFKKNKTQQELYFGIFFQASKVLGFVYRVEDEKISILARDTVPYSNSWESIVDDVDALLSSLEDETELSVYKTIFFLYSTFVDEKNHEIKSNYKKAIKTISKELDLEPLGYIECYDAVREYIENEHQGPFNGNLVEVDKKHVGVFSFKGGRNVFTRDCPRTDNIGDDISNMFSHKDGHLLLPSRTIVYGTINSEEMRKQLTDYSWDDSFFVQLPRIEFFEDKEFYKALSDIFLKQILDTKKAKTTKNNAIDEDKDDIDNKIDEKNEEKEEEKKTIDDEIDQIIAKDEEKEKNKKEEKDKDKDEQDEAEMLGFVINQDIKEVDAEKALHKEVIKNDHQVQKDIDFAVKENKPIKDSKKNDKEQQDYFAFVKKIKMPKIALPDIYSFLPKKLPFGTIIVWLVILLIFAGLGVAAEYFVHKVNLIVSFPAEVVSEEMKLSLLPDEEQEGIVIREHTLTKELSDSKTATGTKEVGEKSTGTVLLHNFDEEPIEIGAGTAVSVDGISFTLNEGATIPAAQEATGDSGVIQEPGKVSVSATADDIGEQYNIEGGKRMQLGSLSQSVYFGLSEGEFTGGSKRNVTIVAQADHDKLEERIEAEAKKIDTSEVKSNLKEGEKVIDALTTVNLDTLKFSRNVGEESDELSLNATVEIKAYVYNEETVKKTIFKKLEPQVPKGYKLSIDTIEYDFNNVKAESIEVEDEDEEQKITKTVSFTLVADANVVKKIDKEKMRSDLAGKFMDDVNFILKDEYEVKDYKIEEESQYLFIFSRWMPFFKQNIEIKTKN